MISLITCAYRPDEETFARVLHSIGQLKTPVNEQVEYIIVDNAGDLHETSLVKDFLQRHRSWVRIVHEKKPGLTQARLRGFEESSGDYLVFFDQDNEPSDNYLVEASRLLTANPSVGVCGPGNVTVVFTGAVEKWVEKHARGMMQETHLKEEGFTNEPLEHDDLIPYGTGMIVRRRVMERYRQKIVTGEYSGADRSAGNLNSGGDVQIVFCAATNGELVGRSPLLQLNHLMTPDRSIYSYIRRFSFGNGLETFPVIAQAYPDRVSAPKSALYESLLFFYQSTREFFKWTVARLNPRMTICKTASIAAFKYGQYGYYKRPVPTVIRWAKKLMKV